jgi:uncharacterized membrane protein (UPF0127 family)
MRLAFLPIAVALLTDAACNSQLERVPPPSKEKVPAAPAFEPGATASALPPPAKATEPMRPSAVVFLTTPDGERKFRVEVADEGPERARGLMLREQMGEDEGMLFVFERAQMQSFWMKNTRLALDMLFIDDNGVVVGIVENAEPMTTTSRKVDKPSRYVLELLAGTSRRLGLAAGQQARFEGVPGHPAGTGGSR